MGLLSFTGLATGALGEVYNWQKEAEKKQDVYNENLANAVNNVNKITKELGANYDNAVRLSNLVGGGSFANYLMDAESLERLSTIYKLSGDDRDEEILNLKKTFDAVDKSKYENRDFTETAKQKLEKEVSAVKQEEIGGVGVPPTATSKFESFITQGVRGRGEQIRGDIMTGITPPSTTVSYAPTEGSLQSIVSRATTGSLPTVDRGDILGYLKNTIETFGLQNMEKAKPFQEDYDKLISSETSPVDKATIENKYKYDVLQLKVPLSFATTSTTTTGQPDVIDYRDILNEDETPNYTDSTT